MEDNKLKVKLQDVVRVVEPRQHNELLGLDYESSGHTGFASSQEVNELKSEDTKIREEIQNVKQEIENGVVSGVKGDAESEYRKGQVNITKSNIGLGNVDNTSDANKPISRATQMALDSKEDKANLKALAYKDGLSKSDVGLDKVNNVAITESQVAQIGANESEINNLKSKLGVANGIATLDSDGKVPATQLPSYVDDVLEYYGMSNFPNQGEVGKIYVNTKDGKTYRWSGTTYVEISSSLALGETSSTAYAGDKGKANAENIAQLNISVNGLRNDVYSNIDRIVAIENGTKQVGDSKKLDGKESSSFLNNDNLGYVPNYNSVIVPNSGEVKKVYFNTSLSIKEVINLFNNLNFVESSGAYLYGILYGSLVGAIVIQYSPQNDISDFAIYRMGGNGGMIFSSIVAENDGRPIAGWYVDEIEINGEVSNDYNGLPIGMENDKLANLVSTTRFVATKVGVVKEEETSKLYVDITNVYKDLNAKIDEKIASAIDNSIATTLMGDY